MKNQIICEKRHYTTEKNKHSHDYAQLMLPMRGNVLIETSYKELSIEEKYMFFLPPDCDHFYQGNVDNEMLVLDIPTHMVSKEHMERIKGGMVVPFDERWHSIRSLLLSELMYGNKQENLNQLFYYFYNILINEEKPESISYIHDHYTEDIHIEFLAELEHYNASYYTEWFKKQMGMTPKEYIQQLRIKKAKELIVDTDYSMIQIGLMVGYQHPSSFSRAFKDLTGLSPNEYRIKSKKKLIHI